MFFKEVLYILPLTIISITIIAAYVLFNSRRESSPKKVGENPKQEDEADPDENIEEEE